jgi:hypothetical protein
MISFEKLGNYGRLGNQLFQYAFLRTTAQALGTKFFCPKWDGDDIFNLNDENERSKVRAGITHLFNSHPAAGYTSKVLSIKDNTEIEGFFQSEKYYFDKDIIFKWYSFNNDIIDQVNNLYGDILKNDCVSFSLRLDSDYGNTREYFPLYPISFYKKSLSLIKPKGTILVFSDRPDLARNFLRDIKNFKFVFIDNLNAPQQLYLMTLCRANVITNSTFSWWGAWLNQHPLKIVVAPEEWCRPGVPNPVEGIICEDWIKLPGTHPFLDHFQVWRIRHPIATIKRLFARFS